MTQAVADEALEAAAARVTEAVRDARFGRLDPMGLAWLALPPMWTKRLATMVRYPTGALDLDSFLTAAESYGIAQVERPIAATGGDRNRSRVLGLLVRAAGETLAAEALDDIAAIEDEAARAAAVADVASFVPAAALGRVLEMAGTIQQPELRADCLATIASVAGGEHRSEALARALDAIGKLAPVAQAELAAVVAPMAPEPERLSLVGRALDVASATRDDVERADLLAALADALVPALEDRYVAAARDLREPGARAVVLAAAWDGLSRPALRTLRAAFGETSPGALDVDIGDLELAAATLGDDIAALEEAARTIGRLSDGALRGRVQGALAESAAPYRPELAQQLAAEAAQLLLGAGLTSVAVLMDLQVAERLSAAGAAAEAERLVVAAAAIASSLPGTVDSIVPLVQLSQAQARAGNGSSAVATASRAYGLAGRLGDVRQRTMAVAGLLPSLTPEDRAAALAICRDGLAAAGDLSERAEILAALAPHLDQAEVTRDARAILDAIRSSGSDAVFTMPDAMREEALEYLTTSSPPIDLQATSREIGSRIVRAAGTHTSVPAPLGIWAEIASVLDPSDPTEAVRRFGEGVRRAIEIGDTTRASALIGAGGALAPAVGAQMDSAVRLANRRLTLVFRSAQDRRHLQHYLERRDQTEALADLLGGRGEGWALHLLGMGGVGKTMLLRHLTTELAARMGYAVSRVDFDYMSPDYPVYRPGQLFLELMGELETFATSTAASEYVRRVEDSVVRLHEELTTEARAEAPLAGLDRRGFEDILVSFRDFLSQLDRPILLILDTCEELAKIQSPDASLPSVEATFQILERLMVGAPPVKVVFAGRRLLARSGVGWTASDAQAGEARAQLPKHKDWLRLHEVRGFTGREARAYLTDIKGLSVDEPTIAAILRLSPDAGTAAQVDWDRPSDEQVEDRFNPFDLSLYADWAAEMPEPSPDLLGAADQSLYVDRRIVGRIGNPDVRALVPAAVLLTRFDRAMIRPAFDSESDRAFENAYRELSAQEWIDLQRDERSDTTLLQVDLHLHRRLRAYFADPRRAGESAAAARRLTPALRDGLASRALSDLSPEYVNAALALLPAVQASAAWDGLVHRVAAEGRWDWAERVTGRLLAEDGAAAGDTSAVRASVIGLRAAALTHITSSGIANSEWRAVAAAVAREPDPDIRDWLLLRRAAALVAGGEAAPEDRQRVVDALRAQPRLGEPGDPAAGNRAMQSAASLVRAADQIVAEAEEVGSAGMRDAAALAAVASYARALRGTHSPVHLRVIAILAAVRALTVSGDLGGARQLLAELPIGPAAEPTTEWLDWIAPTNLVDATRLERLRLAASLGVHPADDDVLQWMADAATRLSSIDAERLVSAGAQAILRHRLLSGEELDRLEAADTYAAARQPRSTAHRAVEPLFVTIAVGRLGLGDVASAISGLERRAAAAEAEVDELTQRAATAAKVRIARRMRLSIALASDVDRLAASDDDASIALALPAIALTRGHTGGERDGIATLFPHLWWRCQTTLVPERAAVLERLGPRAWPAMATIDEHSTFDDVSLAFDRREWAVAMFGIPAPAAPTFGIPRPPELLTDAPTDGFPGFSASRWAERHPTEVEEALRLALRSWALRGDSEPSVAPRRWATRELPPELDRWAALGPRWVAETALDEGELLALRSPARGGALLRLARDLYDSAGDACGSLIAGTCATIAGIHAQQGSDAGIDLRATYERLQEQRGPSLPRWDVIAAAAARRDPAPLPAESSEPWTPWLLRLYFALAARSGRRRVPLPQPLDSMAPAMRPIELVTDPTGVSGLDMKGSSFGRDLLIGLGAIAAVVAVAVLLLGVFLPTATVLDRLLLLGAIAIGLGALAFVVSPIRSAATALVVAESPLLMAAVEAADAETQWSRRAARGRAIDVALYHQMAMVVKDRLSLRAVLFAYVEVFSAAIGLRSYRILGRTGTVPSVPVGGPYQPVGPRLPGDVVERLRWTHERLWRLRAPVRLETAPAVEGVPWDAFVVLAATPKLAIPSDCRLDPFRGDQPMSSPRRRPHDRLRVTAVVDRSWTSLVTQGWGQQSAITALRDAIEVVPDETDVLHIIGRPIETGSGTVVQVARRDGGPGSETVEKRVRGGLSRSAGAGPTPEAVRPALLVSHGIPLVILQEEPVEASARAESDRVQAARMRAASSTVFRGGAETVIMIPALPPALAAEVIALLRRRLGRVSAWGGALDRGARALGVRSTTYPLREVLRAAREARDLIASWPRRRKDEGGDPRAFLEMSLDVTVFARSHQRDVPISQVEREDAAPTRPQTEESGAEK